MKQIYRWREEKSFALSRDPKGHESKDARKLSGEALD